ncbi:DEAD/DEAH box helicase [Cytobacillus pseudoceanisediminis]|uniref:DEAD/DEAH box helicase n=1 Tax=Cytobacillus pseudoceanisediminis TaxID=3051614 RepID=A0ABZ2ZQN0_9BACI
MIFNRLSEDVLVDEYFISLFKKLSEGYGKNLLIGTEVLFSNKELKDLLRFSDILSNSTITSNRNLAYKIVSLLQYMFKDNPIYQNYSTAILAKLGNFPALNLLNFKVELPYDRRIEANTKKIIQRVDGLNGPIFTDSQYALFKRLKNSNYFSFAGPTSMGKSFLIKAFIKNIINEEMKQNIVILVPTRALINQFVTDLNKEVGQELRKNNYNIHSNFDTSFLNPRNKYIFVLTPERLLGLLSEVEKPNLGILFVDEAHKLSAEKDYRSITLYLAIEKAIKYFKNLRVYFSSPNVSNPEIFLELFNIENNSIYKTNETPVGQNLFYIDLLSKRCKYFSELDVIDISIENIDYFTNSLQTIYKLGSDNANIIYCNSTDTTVNLARDFIGLVDRTFINSLSKAHLSELNDAINTISEIIHPHYFLIDCLNHGIGFHFGRLPHIVRVKIEKLFKKGIIKYLFCTSTLLEGVNLPAKNIFILKNKKGNSKMSKIDFWNLAGRAGRLNFELTGNIFCIRDGMRDWSNTDLFVDRDSIKLETSIDNKLDNRLRKIEQIFNDNGVDKVNNKEDQIINYLANIILIDRIDREKSYESPLIKKLIDKEQYEILSKADDLKNKIAVPIEIVQQNYSIMVSQQDKVYNLVSNSFKRNKSPHFPNKVNYKNCLAVLNVFYEAYEWEKYEKSLENKEKLKYIAQLMNNWINGASLKTLIVNTLKYKDENNKDIYYSFKGNRIKEKFNINNTLHVNHEINVLLADIEKILQFTLEKYFSSYFSILEFIFKEDAGPNWSSFLEYGTKNPIIILLQNMGFSRQTAMFIYNECPECLSVEENKLIGLDKGKLTNLVGQDSLYYDEILTVLALNEK